MTWTYEVDDLSTSSLMQLRLMIGDTDTDQQLMQDEELTYWLDTEGGVRQAAIAALEALAAIWSKKADRTIGPLSIKYSQMSANFCSRAQGLRIDRLALDAEPYAGGLSRAEKEVDDQDTDLVRPYFRRSRFEHFDVPTPRLSPWYSND